VGDPDLDDVQMRCPGCGYTKAECAALKHRGQVCCPDCRHVPGPPVMPRDYLATASVWTILDLICAEWRSDTSTLAGFDGRIVQRAIALNEQHKARGSAKELWDRWEARRRCKENDTDGDGHCGRRTCPICHPEHQPVRMEVR
jgi:hypothetical protein